MEWLIISWAGVIVVALLASHANAKAQVARIERKLNLLLRQHGIDPSAGASLSDRVKEIARDPAKKIQAIKIYREETGAGLADAKEAIEAYINGH